MALHRGGSLGEKAAEYWLKAGHSALRRSAMHEALIHLRRGISALPPNETAPWRVQREADLTIALGKAQIATQGYAIASTGETFAKAQALCARLGNPPQLLAVLHGLWTHALLRAEFPSAQRQAEALLQRGRDSGDRMWLLMGNRFSGVTHHPRGDFVEASRLLEEGLELYDPAQQAVYWAMTVDDPRVIMLTYLSWSQMCLGRIANALKLSERAVEEAKQMQHAYTLAHALNGAAFVALTIVSPQAALARLDEQRALLADNGIAYYEAVETIFRGWCLASDGPTRERDGAPRRRNERVPRNRKPPLPFRLPADVGGGARLGRSGGESRRPRARGGLRDGGDRPALGRGRDPSRSRRAGARQWR